MDVWAEGTRELRGCNYQEDGSSWAGSLSHQLKERKFHILCRSSEILNRRGSGGLQRRVNWRRTDREQIPCYLVDRQLN